MGRLIGLQHLAATALPMPYLTHLNATVRDETVNQ